MLLLFFCAVFSHIISADEGGESIVAPLVEDDLRQARADIRTLERNIKSLDELLGKIQGAQIHKTPPDAASESNWNKGKAIVENFKYGETGSARYRQALVFLSESLEGSMQIKGAFWNRTSFELYFDRDSTIDSSYLKAARGAASEAVAKYMDSLKSAGAPLSLLLPGNSMISRILQDEDDEIDPEEIKNNISILKTLTSRGYEAVYSSVQDGYFEATLNGKIAAEAALKEIRTQERENLREKRKELSNFILEFKKLEKQDEKRRESTDIRLVYAVYGMIAVLLCLFLGLKVFSDDVAKSLIVNRSLVEVVGMAFMLITIIILGTGEKLSKEILGTLLGTIAGYVFARGTEDARTNKKVADSN